MKIFLFLLLSLATIACSSISIHSQDGSMVTFNEVVAGGFADMKYSYYDMSIITYPSSVFFFMNPDIFAWRLPFKYLVEVLDKSSIASPCKVTVSWENQEYNCILMLNNLPLDLDNAASLSQLPSLLAQDDSHIVAENVFNEFRLYSRNHIAAMAIHSYNYVKVDPLVRISPLIEDFLGEQKCLHWLFNEAKRSKLEKIVLTLLHDDTVRCGTLDASMNHLFYLEKWTEATFYIPQ